MIYDFDAETINVSENSKHYCSEDGVVYNKDKTELLWYPYSKTDKKFTVPDTVETVKHINNKNIEELIFSDSVRRINRTSLSACTSLRKVHFGKNFEEIIYDGEFDVENQNPFWSCKKLETITVSPENKSFKAMSVVFNVNIHLLEGNVDAVFIKRSFNGFHNIKINCPIIRIFAPNTGGICQRAVCVGRKTNNGCGFRKRQRVCLNDLAYQFFNSFIVTVVCNVKGEIHSASIFCGIIFDHRVGEGAVGDGYAFVVGCKKFCVDNGDLHNSAGFAGSLDEITNFKGFEEEDHESACKVAE